MSKCIEKENEGSLIVDADMISSSAKVVIEALKLKYAEWRRNAVRSEKLNPMLLSVSDEMNDTVINYISGMLLVELSDMAS